MANNLEFDQTLSYSASGSKWFAEAYNHPQHAKCHSSHKLLLHRHATTNFIAHPLSAVGRAMAYGAGSRELDPWARRVLCNDLIDDIMPEVISFSTTDSHVMWRIRLPRLQNFVNVYTIGKTRNDTV
mgnify:CR=1 FL=1